jgi:hypothetical protein
MSGRTPGMGGLIRQSCLPLHRSLSGNFQRKLVSIFSFPHIINLSIEKEFRRDDTHIKSTIDPDDVICRSMHFKLPHDSFDSHKFKFLAVSVASSPLFSSGLSFISANKSDSFHNSSESFAFIGGCCELFE